MAVLEAFRNLPLRGGFSLKEVTLTAKPMADAVGMPALARTVIIGSSMTIELRDDLTESELSISLFHEVRRQPRSP